MKRALITGITGQDGAYLAKLLVKKGYKVFGGHRKASIPNFWRLHYLNIHDKIDFLPFDLSDSKSISKMLKNSEPDVVYNCAAQSAVGSSFDHPSYTSDVTGSGVIRMLEGIKNNNNKIKFFQASSSEMFGAEKSRVKNESTAFYPISPYAISKVYAYWMTRMYREAYGMYTVNGILFNHESPLRGIEYVTRKISNGIAKISLGLEKDLKLGNTLAERDWGYAPEYVEGIFCMMEQKKADDYILATGETHSIKEFVDEACKVANISNSKIKSTKENFRPQDIQKTKGSYKKAEKELGWSPKTKFKKIVKIMVEADMDRWEKFLKKESQAWDVGK
jgi:GDPmannose 4,6-dehydratase